MVQIIIEEINRLGHVINRHKFDQLPVSIGRSYRNDLILSDPYVSPQHVIIDESDTGWLVEDQESENGIRFRRHSTQSRANHLLSGDEIIIGRTRLRLVSPWHAVAKTHLLPTKASLPKIIAQPALAGNIIVLAIILQLLDAQLTTTVATSFDKLLVRIFPTFMFSLAWAGVWTFVGRVIMHRASFIPHFIAALLTFIISLLVEVMSEYLSYNLNNELLSTALEFFVVGFTLVGLFYINLSNSTNVIRRSVIVISHSVAWSLLLIGLFMQYVNKPDFVPSPEYPTHLKAPFAKLAHSVSPAQFLEDSDYLFTHKTN